MTRSATGRRVWVGALLAAGLAGASHAQSVLVVDAAGGGDFETLPSAVEAAVDGDVLLLRAGTYDPLVVTGKSLTIEAEAGASVIVSETLHIENLAPTQSVTLRGLDVDASAADVAFAGSFDGCMGPVLVQDCTFDGSGGPLVSGGLFVVDCTSVVLSRVRSTPTLTAGGSFGRAGVFAVSSAVYAYECVLTGSDGLETFTGPIPGANGVTLFSASLFASGCLLTGGDGGNGNFTVFGCTDGGDGGDGVELGGTSPSTAYLLDNAATGGTPGTSGGPACSAGVPGQPFRDVLGTTTVLAGASRSFTTASPVREGQSYQETFQGPPGEVAAGAFSFSLVNGVLFPGFLGAVHIAPGGFNLFRGTIPAGGTLVASTTVPELGLGFDAVVIYEQAVFIDPGTLDVFLGPPAATALLDDSF